MDYHGSGKTEVDALFTATTTRTHLYINQAIWAS